jgi:hypothetical protein
MTSKLWTSGYRTQAEIYITYSQKQALPASTSQPGQAQPRQEGFLGGGAEAVLRVVLGVLPEGGATVEEGLGGWAGSKEEEGADLEGPGAASFVVVFFVFFFPLQKVRIFKVQCLKSFEKTYAAGPLFLLFLPPVLGVGLQKV